MKKKEEAEKQQEDEEGWTKVTKGPKGAKARPHSEAANRRTLQKEMKKKKRKELLNFYSWQHKNTQKERKLSFYNLYFFSEPVLDNRNFFSPHQILLN